MLVFLEGISAEIHNLRCLDVNEELLHLPDESTGLRARRFRVPFVGLVYIFNLKQLRGSS